MKIVLFGYPSIIVDNTPIEIGRRKALALLVYLVATRRPQAREHLCALLWEDAPPATARAELRRMISTLKQTPLAPFIEANRDMVRFVVTDAVEVDLWELDRLLNEGASSGIAANIDHWLAPFADGLQVTDAPQYEAWQRLMSAQLHQRLTIVIENLVLSAQIAAQYHECIRLLQAWCRLDEDNEALHRQLLQCYVQVGQREMALAHYRDLLQRRLAEGAHGLEEETTALVRRIEMGDIIPTPTLSKGFLPPQPGLIVGREDVLAALKERLGSPAEDDNPRRWIVAQGWPGIGKTTLTMALAHDPAVRGRFPDGVFWASLGQTPNLLAILHQWGLALGLHTIHQTTSISEASALLANALSERQVLLIIDDVWDEAHVTPFKIGGRYSAMLITTRLNRVAQALITTRQELYKIPVLDEKRARQLMTLLVPEAVSAYPQEVDALIQALEGLPLALQVAGRLLREEQSLGWGIRDLLQELRDGVHLLQASAPADRQNPDDAFPMTVSALLALSTNTLEPTLRERFAMLGVFAPKPAIFDLGALQAVWDSPDPRATIRRLVERGLLEAVADGAFQMHALLVQHARSLFS